MLLVLVYGMGWMPLPRGQISMIPEGTTQADTREKLTSVLLTFDSDKLLQWIAWNDS